MKTMADDVYEQLKVAPKDIVLEVHDFVEFLIKKRMQEKPSQKSGRTIESFIGTLKDSPSFRGDPLDIQRKMRDEWT